LVDVITFYDYETDGTKTATIESIDPISTLTRYINVMKHADEYTDGERLLHIKLYFMALERSKKE